MIFHRRLVARVFLLGLVALLHPDRRNVIPSGMAHPWHIVNGRHWQVETGTVELPAETDAREGTRGACPAGMVEVNGKMKVDEVASIDDLQKPTCTE